MNTYDFDKTIYENDSSSEFFVYCLKKYPLAVLKAIPGIVLHFIFYKLNRRTFVELKEKTFAFLEYIPDIDETARSFWKEKRGGIGKWYLKRKKSDDVIISASPEFLLKPVSEMLGVELIATLMDKRTGKITGLNCHDREKVRRFYEKHPNAVTEEFYSDSLVDTPMAEIAQKAFRVKNGKIFPWRKNK